MAMAGVKIGTNLGSTATLSGFLYLDDFAIDTVPPIVFDFEMLEFERDLAWEIINEPEWAMREVEKDYEVGDPVSVAEMVEFVRSCAQILHAHTSHPVTVGSARRKWLTYWQDCRLDLYQFHWYDKFAVDEPFPWPPCSELGLDKPCLIGEVATDSTEHTAEEYLHAACAGAIRASCCGATAPATNSPASREPGPASRAGAPLPDVDEILTSSAQEAGENPAGGKSKRP
jgi:hypothetical protein